eukprot:evm.model.scf_768.7 EVM.evm.TU.scf_768.7   scf_768:46516-52162(+)
MVPLARDRGSLRRTWAGRHLLQKDRLAWARCLARPASVRPHPIGLGASGGFVPRFRCAGLARISGPSLSAGLGKRGYRRWSRAFCKARSLRAAKDGDCGDQSVVREAWAGVERDGLLKRAWEHGMKPALVAGLLLVAAGRPALACASRTCAEMDALAVSVERSPSSQHSPSGPPGTSSSHDTVDTRGSSNPMHRGGYRDTGIRLAEDADEEAGNSEQKTATKKSKKTKGERLAEKRKKERSIVKKGKRVDINKSVVPDPTLVPENDSKEAKALMSNWRMDKLKDISYTQFWALVREGRVDKVQYTRDYRSLWVDLKDSAPGGAQRIKIGIPFDPDLMNHLVSHGVYISEEMPSPLSSVLFSLFRLTVPITVAFFLVQASFRLGERKPGQDQIFGGANLDMMEAKKMQLTFKDIAGIDEVKEEIKEIVSFLKNPARFTELGARSPAGILLVGPPGTGKTLLAKAIAGQAEVPFFSTAGTEFMEMYVGVGAARVRDMFQKARKAAPCILFIDEFDGVGKQRSQSAGNDESVHTINQLLTEMDGFEDNTGVVVIAATNRPGSLDTALTRPGRFDRIIHLPLPNLAGRIEILKVHARGKKLEEGLEFSKVARATAGYTGADLMNLMNQSAIVAVRQVGNAARNYLIDCCWSRGQGSSAATFRIFQCD